MSIATLSKFTVPLASDQSASNQGLLMPKLKYRFRLSLENFGVSTPTTVLTKQVVDVTRPSITFDNIVLDVYNSRVNIHGKHTWADMTVNLRDDVTGEVSKLVGEQLQKQFDFFEQASAASGIDYKFTSRIEMLDGGNGTSTPTVLETWECYGCYVLTANYGNMAYNANEDVRIALTIKYDNAIQSPQGTGVGTVVGRTVGTLTTGGGV
jgi:hypothetical protein